MWMLSNSLRRIAVDHVLQRVVRLDYMRQRRASKDEDHLDKVDRLLDRIDRR